MSVGLKSSNHQRRVRSHSTSVVGSGQSQPHGNVAPIHNLQTVPYLPNSRRRPLWLNSLIGAQRSSSLIAFLLISAVMVVYGQTVYTQQLWSREYRKLETLQRHERQLTTTNESLKDQIVQQAEKSTGNLVPVTSSNSIFVKPAPPRPAPKQDAQAPAKSELVDPSPVGY